MPSFPTFHFLTTVLEMLSRSLTFCVFTILSNGRCWLLGSQLLVDSFDVYSTLGAISTTTKPYDVQGQPTTSYTFLYNDVDMYDVIEVEVALSVVMID